LPWLPPLPLFPLHGLPLPIAHGSPGVTPPCPFPFPPGFPLPPGLPLPLPPGLPFPFPPGFPFPFTPGFPVPLPFPPLPLPFPLLGGIGGGVRFAAATMVPDLEAIALAPELVRTMAPFSICT
jgi:hypothetical protein